MPEQNLPAAAVSRQPCDRTRVIHALNCRSLRLPNEPNPNGGDFCPGFGICDCYVSEIERLRLALRIAVEEIQDWPHDEDCEYIGSLLRFDRFNGRKLPTKPCSCRHDRALARIERTKETGKP